MTYEQNKKLFNDWYKKNIEQSEHYDKLRKKDTAFAAWLAREEVHETELEDLRGAGLDNPIQTDWAGNPRNIKY